MRLYQRVSLYKKLGTGWDIKLEEYDMKRFIKWHKDRIECVAISFGLSHYQLLWAAAVTGVVIGYIVGRYL